MKKLTFIQLNTENAGKKSPENNLNIYEKNVSADFSIVPLTDDSNDLRFICDLLTDSSNISTLHLTPIPDCEYLQFYDEMREALLSETDDELNFIIRNEIVPVAWLKINGLSEDSLWISMLVVHGKYRRQGAGNFAMNFVNEFARSTGRRYIYIHTTVDNKAALAFYKKSGYTVTAENEQQYGDGNKLVRYTLHKEFVLNE